MTDPHSAHTRLSSDTRGNGGSRHHPETASQSSTPSSTRNKSDSSEPARPGSVRNARQTNGTPRLRSRPASVRSLSTPLGRSLSMRVSKKEKRLSLRLDLKRPVSTTYRDDYQSPEALSLHSLNLDTTTEADSSIDLNAPTTYRESFKWKPQWLSRMSRSEDNSEATGKLHPGKDTPDKVSNKSALADGNSDSSPRPAPFVSPKSRTVIRNDQVSEANLEKRNESIRSRPAIQSPTSARSLSFIKRNGSTVVNYGGNHNQQVVSPETKSSASSTEANVPLKSTNEKGKVAPKSSNGNVPPVGGGRLQHPGTPQTQKLANGTAGLNVSGSEDRTPRKMRAYQLQSSNGGSPFVYGSGSGAWV